MMVDDVDQDKWEDEAPPVLPLDEEGMFLSAVGGEHAIWEEFFKPESSSSQPHRKRKDTRTRRDRLVVSNRDWQQQIHRVVEGYLTGWKAGIVPCVDTDVCAWDVTFIDFHQLRAGVVAPSSPDEYPNEALARLGYIGTAPLKPAVANTIQTLEAYRQLHHVCPRLSIHTQVQALCRLHEVTFSRTLVNQFSIAYDVYLEVLHHINFRINSLLGRTTPNWRMLNACAPCLYKLEGEAPLKYSLLVNMDGNQSLKLVDDLFRAGATRQDERTGRSDLWLTPSEVDQWKDEVCRPTSENTQADVSVCVERWRNAGPEVRKKMFALFAITGVFVCLCRHGHLLVICDMIRSGELLRHRLRIRPNSVQ
ncbi:hypothetical protein FOMPIDRAFT_130893 [Fomitopsis schrenkii]|uniref:CxC1-like cysteine cluster associated with KDZ transposases domain-containing protein n=1 Tax=Fomitopsis schrenkii TaxID=2126942 RepID=S8DUW1_FOMSC|nr:hypothetical protein FOMPIDRAFT_130893 [Fomitopsis schrenkii]